MTTPPASNRPEKRSYGVSPSSSWCMAAAMAEQPEVQTTNRRSRELGHHLGDLASALGVVRAADERDHARDLAEHDRAADLADLDVLDRAPAGPHREPVAVGAGNGHEPVDLDPLGAGPSHRPQPTQAASSPPSGVVSPCAAAWTAVGISASTGQAPTQEPQPPQAAARAATSISGGAGRRGRRWTATRTATSPTFAGSSTSTPGAVPETRSLDESVGRFVRPVREAHAVLGRGRDHGDAGPRRLVVEVGADALLVHDHEVGDARADVPELPRRSGPQSSPPMTGGSCRSRCSRSRSPRPGPRDRESRGSRGSRPPAGRCARPRGSRASRRRIEPSPSSTSAAWGSALGKSKAETWAVSATSRATWSIIPAWKTFDSKSIGSASCPVWVAERRWTSCPST